MNHNALAPMKSPEEKGKSELVKARVTAAMKAAVTAAAGGECEAVVIRKALREYLGRHGYQLGEEPPQDDEPRRSSRVYELDHSADPGRRGGVTAGKIAEKIIQGN